MIYTITFNPAIDYIVEMDKFDLGNVNRTNREEVCVGGKGINVSIVLNNLSIENKALGFVAGFTGDEIEKRLIEAGCNIDFVKLKSGISRINVKMKTEVESEINGGGPDISNEALEELYLKLDYLMAGDILVLAGSIPKTLPVDIYERIMNKYEDRGVKFIVDTSGEALLKVLNYNPFLIKPNHNELAQLFNVKINSNKEIVEYGKKLQEMGAENVLISMAGDGAILIKSNGEVIYSKAPNGVLKGSVGAGDSMVAGFIAGYIKEENLEDGLIMGVATGSASAFSEGLATEDKVYSLLEKIKYEII